MRHSPLGNTADVEERRRRLAEAVAAGDYAEAARAVERYRAELDRELKSAGAERAAALCAAARETVERARRAVCAERARLGEGLARLARIRHYRPPPNRTARTDLTA